VSNRFPFPLPTGWFQVAYSDELKPGDVVPLRYFERDLVLFRTESGVASLLDAHCPHLGAHLGHGGKVDGESIACPFHDWRFGADGGCTSVPYANKQPRKSSVACWPLREVNGLLMTWHDTAGRAPFWEVPELEEYGHEEWTEYVLRRWTIRTCNQEMAENAVDKAHFHYLHGTREMPETKYAETHDHLLRTQSTTPMTTPMGDVDGLVTVDAYGFGFTTTRFTGLAETLLVNSVTPIENGLCDVRFAFSVRKTYGASVARGIGKAFVAEVERQLEQDIPIWENKVFLPRPVLCDGDGPIGLFRTWARQFYPSSEQLTAT